MGIFGREEKVQIVGAIALEKGAPTESGELVFHTHTNENKQSGQGWALKIARTFTFTTGK